MRKKLIPLVTGGVLLGAFTASAENGLFSLNDEVIHEEKEVKIFIATRQKPDIEKFGANDIYVQCPIDRAQGVKAYVTLGHVSAATAFDTLTNPLQPIDTNSDEGLTAFFGRTYTVHASRSGHLSVLPSIPQEMEFLAKNIIDPDFGYGPDAKDKNYIQKVTETAKAICFTRS